MPSLAAGSATARHDLDGDRVGVGLGPVELRVERLLADALAGAAAAGGARQQFVDGASSSSSGTASSSGPTRRRWRRRRVAGEHQLHQPLASELRATGTAGVWQNQPPLPPGSANPADSAAIARSHDATSSTGGGREAVHAGDDDLRHRLDGPHQGRAELAASHAHRRGPARPRHRSRARRRTPALLAEHDARGVRPAGASNAPAVPQVLGGQGVSPRRAVHGDPDRVAVFLDPRLTGSPTYPQLYVACGTPPAPPVVPFP